MCYLLSSFVDYYAQELNILLHLELLEMKNNSYKFPLAPETNHIEDILHGNYSPVKGKVVTIYEVINKIKKVYKIDKNLRKMFDILYSNMINKQLAHIRNFQAHNQILFGKVIRSSGLAAKGGQWTSFSVNSTNDETFIEFIEFAYNVIQKFFLLMVIFDTIKNWKLPLKKGQNEGEVFIIKCPICNKEIIYPYSIHKDWIAKVDKESFIFCTNKSCKEKILLSRKFNYKKINVHPDKFIGLFNDVVRENILPINDEYETPQDK